MVLRLFGHWQCVGSSEALHPQQPSQLPHLDVHLHLHPVTTPFLQRWIARLAILTLGFPCCVVPHSHETLHLPAWLRVSIVIPTLELRSVKPWVFRAKSYIHGLVHVSVTFFTASFECEHLLYSEPSQLLWTLILACVCCTRAFEYSSIAARCLVYALTSLLPLAIQSLGP
jgi:hypothetical protein